MSEYLTYFQLIQRGRIGTIQCQNSYWVAGKYYDPPDWEAVAQAVLDYWMVNKVAVIAHAVNVLYETTSVTCQAYNVLFQPQLGIPLEAGCSVFGTLGGQTAGSMQVYNVAYRLSPTIRDTPFGHPPVKTSHTPLGPISEGLVGNDNVVAYGSFPGGLVTQLTDALTQGWTSPGGEEYVMARVGAPKLIGGDPDPNKNRAWAMVTGVLYRPQASFLRSRAK